MSLKKVVLWLTFAMVVLYVVNSPQHAGQLVRSAGSALADAGSSLASFVAAMV